MDQDVAKLQETVGYLFKRTKSLSSSISSFHEQHCLGPKHLDVTQENLLSYENTISKLEQIFQRFVEMKSKDPAYKAVSLKTIPTHAVNGNVNSPVVGRLRSKSPTPYSPLNHMMEPKKLGDLEAELGKPDAKSKFLKKNITYIK